MTKMLLIQPDEVEFLSICAQGPGGQNVNKVASAIHLRFVIEASSLPADVKHALRTHRDKRISKDGVIVIKAQQHRTQQQNKIDALQRLQSLLDAATTVKPRRKPTKRTKSSVKKRLDTKKKRGQLKALRAKLPSST